MQKRHLLTVTEDNLKMPLFVLIQKIHFLPVGRSGHILYCYIPAIHIYLLYKRCRTTKRTTSSSIVYWCVYIIPCVNTLSLLANNVSRSMNESMHYAKLEPCIGLTACLPVQFAVGYNAQREGEGGGC